MFQSDLIFSFHSLFYLFRFKNGFTWLDLIFFFHSYSSHVETSKKELVDVNNFAFALTK